MNEEHDGIHWDDDEESGDAMLDQGEEDAPAPIVGECVDCGETARLAHEEDRCWPCLKQEHGLDDEDEEEDDVWDW